jgi:predicted DNA binding protein
MGKVVELTIPTEQFALSDTFTTVPGATAETVPVAAHGDHGSMPFLSVVSSKTGRLTQAISKDDSIEEVVPLSGSNERKLYQVSWRAPVRVILGVLLQNSGSLLSASGTADRWYLQVLFPDQDSISVICENWREHGLDPSIQRVVTVAGKFGFAELQLSQCQHDTLMTAYEMDYYDVPRGVTLEGVADELQVSHQALSERLRRGHRNLIQTTLCESPTPLSPER